MRRRLSAAEILGAPEFRARIEKEEEEEVDIQPVGLVTAGLIILAASTAAWMLIWEIALWAMGYE